MSERRLPIYARWTLAAEGTVVDPRMARPLCPVAAWLVEQDKVHLPRDPDPERISAIRVRTDVMDSMLLQIHDAAAAIGRPLEVWTIGAGFDARWARLAGPLAPAVKRFVEVEESRVLATKGVALRQSPFADLWQRVDAYSRSPAGWTVEPEGDAWPVVILAGLLHRLPATSLRAVLRRIRAHAPGASVLLDLTGVHGVASVGWSSRRLATLGWQVVDDVHLADRETLLSRQGDALCAGMVPVRVQHLVGRASSPVIPQRR